MKILSIIFIICINTSLFSQKRIHGKYYSYIDCNTSEYEFKKDGTFIYKPKSCEIERAGGGKYVIENNKLVLTFLKYDSVKTINDNSYNFGNDVKNVIISISLYDKTGDSVIIYPEKLFELNPLLNIDKQRKWILINLPKSNNEVVLKTKKNIDFESIELKILPTSNHSIQIFLTNKNEVIENHYKTISFKINSMNRRKIVIEGDELYIELFRSKSRINKRIRIFFDNLNNVI